MKCRCFINHFNYWYYLAFVKHEIVQFIDGLYVPGEKWIFSVFYCAYSKSSLIHNALMRKEMAWWPHCGNGRSTLAAVPSQHLTGLRTTKGTLPLCARMSSDAKQMKKTVFYQGRVRNSICLMLWNLDNCWFKNNHSIYIFIEMAPYWVGGCKETGMAGGPVLACGGRPLRVSGKQGIFFRSPPPP